MATDHMTYTLNDSVNMIYRITNNSSSPITYIFPTAQRYEFLVSQNGITIWRWSLGYVFGQAFWFLTLNPGDSTETSSSWSYAVISGCYEVTGFYTYINFISVPVSVNIEFLPVGSNDVTIPNTIYDLSNYPNPFNPTTTISFSIQNDSKVDLSIYNIKEQKIKILAQNGFTKGPHSIIWNGDDNFGNSVSSGIYLYKLNVNGKTEAVKKCLLLK